MVTFEIKSIKNNIERWTDIYSLFSESVLCRLSKLGTRPESTRGSCLFSPLIMPPKISPSLCFARSKQTAVVLIRVNPNPPLYALWPLLLLDLISARVLVQHSTTLSLCSAESFHTWTAWKWMQVAEFTFMTYEGGTSPPSRLQFGGGEEGGRAPPKTHVALQQFSFQSKDGQPQFFPLPFLGTICMPQKSMAFELFLFPPPEEKQIAVKCSRDGRVTPSSVGRDKWRRRGAPVFHCRITELEGI